ncbi:MAG: MGMT family protein [Nanoarchaeota archaeon]|nr:MGMT family protein [Nanoarchaeota archaeon]
MFAAKVYSEISKIPPGRVSTYKAIAQRLSTKAYRAVGTALKRNPDAPRVPCHRVVCSDGSLGGYMGSMNSSLKVSLLAAEGVFVKDGKIVDFSQKLGGRNAS